MALQLWDRYDDGWTSRENGKNRSKRSVTKAS
jgi:hypothetical protein